MRGEMISHFLLLLMTSCGTVCSLKLWRTGGELICSEKRPNRLKRV